MASVATLKRIHQLIWILIYGGLLMLVLGLSVQRTDTAWGWLMVCLGAGAAALGAVLIYVRSRVRDAQFSTKPNGVE